LPFRFHFVKYTYKLPLVVLLLHIVLQKGGGKIY